VLNIPSVSLNGIPTVILSSGSKVGITRPVQVASAEGNPLQVRDASHSLREASRFAFIRTGLLVHFR
jgi:hypothetical protein